MGSAHQKGSACFRASVRVSLPSLAVSSRWREAFLIEIQEGKEEGYNDSGQARVAKSADATDLKSVDSKGSCGFKSRPGHQKTKDLLVQHFFSRYIKFGRVGTFVGTPPILC